MRHNNIQPRDPVALARAVQLFNQQRIKYLREYPETYASPEKTLEWGVADCDDFTILTCAALRGVKIPCRAVFVGTAPKGSVGNIPLKHVYPEAWLPWGTNALGPQAGRWVALEAVKPVPMGWSFGDEKLKAGFRVRVAAIGDKEGQFRGDEGTGIDVDVNFTTDKARAAGQAFADGVAQSALPGALAAKFKAGLDDGTDKTRRALKATAWILALGSITAAVIRR